MAKSSFRRYKVVITANSPGMKHPDATFPARTREQADETFIQGKENGQRTVMYGTDGNPDNPDCSWIVVDQFVPPNPAAQ